MQPRHGSSCVVEEVSLESQDRDAAPLYFGHEPGNTRHRLLDHVVG